MKFDDFDAKMRVYEQSLDQCVLPDMYMVARLDGRGFTKFTKAAGFEKPFDVRFRDAMVETTKYLMLESGMKFIYGYTESDEISLLFHPEDNSFNRKTRKLNTTLAGIASAYFTSIAHNILGNDKIICSFDCRIAPLPNIDRVTDYFKWREEDSHRNSLNGWCYWTLRKEGKSKGQATSILSGKGDSFKNEMLFERQINYNDLPGWQKRGVGLYFKEVRKEGFNPVTQQTTEVLRKELSVDYDIPLGEPYGEMIERILDESMKN